MTNNINEVFEMDIRWFEAGLNIGPAYQDQYTKKGYTAKEVVTVLSGNTFTIKEVVFESNQDNKKTGAKMQVPHTCVVVGKIILGVIAKMVNGDGAECNPVFQIGKTFGLKNIDSAVNENGKQRGSLHVVCQVVKPVVATETKNKIQELLNASKAIDAKLKGESIKEQSLAILEQQESAKEIEPSYEELQKTYLDEEYVDEEEIAILEQLNKMFKGKYVEIFKEKDQRSTSAHFEEADVSKIDLTTYFFKMKFVSNIKILDEVSFNFDYMVNEMVEMGLVLDPNTPILYDVVKITVALDKGQFEETSEEELSPEEENELALLLKAKEELKLRIKILTTK
jgi:hypothetical protein